MPQAELYRLCLPDNVFFSYLRVSHHKTCGIRGDTCIQMSITSCLMMYLLIGFRVVACTNCCCDRILEIALLEKSPKGLSLM